MTNGDVIRELNNDELADVFVAINQACLKTVLKRFNLRVDEELFKSLGMRTKTQWLDFLNREDDGNNTSI